MVFHQPENPIRHFTLCIFLAIIAGSMLFPGKGFSQSLDQPIVFNHQTHGEEFEISCRFCHYYADRSTHAGVPSLFDCLGCHQLVKGTDEEKQFEIRKLEHLQLFKQPLKWAKINDLPDFVFFSHKSHTIKGYECETCHGEVASQAPPTLTGKIEDLTMKWCLDCHVQKHPTDQNGKIVNQTKLNANPDKAGSMLQATTECHSCHK